MTKKQKISNKKEHGRNEITVFASSRLSLHYKQIICPDYIFTISSGEHNGNTLSRKDCFKL